MRKLLLGLASLAAIAVVTPAWHLALGLYFGAPGVLVGVGAPVYRDHYYYDYDRPRYRAYRYHAPPLRLRAARLPHHHDPA